MNAFNLKGSMKPVEDVTLSVIYGYYTVAKKSTGLVSNGFDYDNGTDYYDGYYTGKGTLGNAIDGTITYDYTEDVQFGLTAGLFLPGNALTENAKNASQVIGSMKVTF
jgi:hypothetical protein